jgi:DNA modification methylase
MSDLSIAYRKVSELRPYARNARTHSRQQIKQIAKSIEQFGFNNPVLVDAEDQVIAGHGRLEAAKLLGYLTVPTVQLAHLNATQKRAYVLADNRLAEKAGWDREILAIELQGLIDIDFEIGLTGFEMPEIDILLDEVAEARQEPGGPEDKVPEASPGPAVSRLGDVWVLGQHRLVCGDARDDAAYSALLKGDKAEHVVTDPPYNVRIDGHVCGLGRVRHVDFKMASGEMSPEAFAAFLAAIFAQLCAHSVNGAIHHVFIDWRHLGEMLAAGKEVYTELKNVCVWNKSNAGMGSFYRSKHELVFVWKNGTAPHINNFELGQHGRSRSNVWDYAGVNSFRAGRMDELASHPTVKPVALVADAIKDCSRRAGLILDPFCGSGTILMAAERTGRKARAIELDPTYVDVAIRRWQLHTGKQAVLEDSNETFEIGAEHRAQPLRLAA